MHFAPDDGEALYRIKAYEPGQIQINDDNFTKSVVIGLDFLISDWPPQEFADLTKKDLISLLDLKPQIVLLGTGVKQYFLKQACLYLFYEQKIGVEVMSTQAACRTYNLLSAEGRKVIAALLIK